MIYWDRVETHWPLKFQLSIGSRVPLHCTAGGKLYLSSLPAERRAKLIAELGLEKRTATTITDPRRLEEAVRQEIGRASWRERVCQYVWISVVAVSLKKK